MITSWLTKSMRGDPPISESTCEPSTSVSPTNWPGRNVTRSAVVCPLAFHACGGAAIWYTGMSSASRLLNAVEKVPFDETPSYITTPRRSLVAGVTAST